MAKITTITNPLTGQPAQVDQLDHTAQQIDDGIGFESTDYPGCYYRMVGGVVEWLNPPMLLDKEYRTTERYNGKPVYVKLVAFGTLPNTGRTSIPHGIDNIENVISARGIESNGMSLPRFNVAYVWGDKINVNVESQADASSNSADILLKYTKTTN